MTDVKPAGNPKGKTDAERGVTRYLGIMFGFEGCDGGGRWKAQRDKVKGQVAAFFGRCDAVRPTFRQYCEVAEGVLLGKVLFSWRVMGPEGGEVEKLRKRVVGRAARCLGVGPMGGEGGADGAEERLLSRREDLGGGVPDVLGRLVGETAVDILQMRGGKGGADWP